MKKKKLLKTFGYIAGALIASTSIVPILNTKTSENTSVNAPKQNFTKDQRIAYENAINAKFKNFGDFKLGISPSAATSALISDDYLDIGTIVYDNPEINPEDINFKNVQLSYSVDGIVSFYLGKVNSRIVSSENNKLTGNWYGSLENKKVSIFSLDFSENEIEKNKILALPSDTKLELTLTTECKNSEKTYQFDVKLNNSLEGEIKLSDEEKVVYEMPFDFKNKSSNKISNILFSSVKRNSEYAQSLRVNVDVQTEVGHAINRLIGKNGDTQFSNEVFKLQPSEKTEDTLSGNFDLVYYGEISEKDEIRFNMSFSYVINSDPTDQDTEIEMSRTKVIQIVLFDPSSKIENIEMSNCQMNLEAGSTYNHFAKFYLNEPYSNGVENDIAAFFQEKYFYSADNKNWKKEVSQTNLSANFEYIKNDSQYSEYDRNSWTIFWVNLVVPSDIIQPLYIDNNGFSSYELYINTKKTIKYNLTLNQAAIYVDKELKFSFTQQNNSIKKDGYFSYENNGQISPLTPISFTNNNNYASKKALNTIKADNPEARHWYTVCDESGKTLEDWNVVSELQSSMDNVIYDLNKVENDVELDRYYGHCSSKTSYVIATDNVLLQTFQIIIMNLVCVLCPFWVALLFTGLVMLGTWLSSKFASGVQGLNKAIKRYQYKSEQNKILQTSEKGLTAVDSLYSEFRIDNARAYKWLEHYGFGKENTISYLKDKCNPKVAVVNPELEVYNTAYEKFLTKAEDIQSAMDIGLKRSEFFLENRHRGATLGMTLEESEYLWVECGKARAKEFKYICDGAQENYMKSLEEQERMSKANIANNRSAALEDLNRRYDITDDVKRITNGEGDVGYIQIDQSKPQINSLETNTEVMAKKTEASVAKVETKIASAAIDYISKFVFVLMAAYEIYSLQWHSETYFSTGNSLAFNSLKPNYKNQTLFVNAPRTFKGEKKIKIKVGSCININAPISAKMDEIAVVDFTESSLLNFYAESTGHVDGSIEMNFSDYDWLKQGENLKAGKIWINNKMDKSEKKVAYICDMQGNPIYSEKGWGIKLHENDPENNYIDFDLYVPQKTSNPCIKIVIASENGDGDFTKVFAHNQAVNILDENTKLLKDSEQKSIERNTSCQNSLPVFKNVFTYKHNYSIDNIEIKILNKIGEIQTGWFGAFNSEGKIDVYPPVTWSGESEIVCELLAKDTPFTVSTPVLVKKYIDAPETKIMLLNTIDSATKKVRVLEKGKWNKIGTGDAIVWLENSFKHSAFIVDDMSNVKVEFSAQSYVVKGIDFRLVKTSSTTFDVEVFMPNVTYPYTQSDGTAPISLFIHSVSSLFKDKWFDSEKQKYTANYLVK